MENGKERRERTCEKYVRIIDRARIGSNDGIQHAAGSAVFREQEIELMIWQCGEDAH